MIDPSEKMKQSKQIVKIDKVQIGFSGNLAKNQVTPRGLTANLTNKLVKIQGIATRISIVRPKL